MRQDMISDEYGGDSRHPTTAERALTHDEQKAAEAAFRGEPFNQSWSVAAAKVYAGIQLAMDKRQASERAGSEIGEECLVER
jgi:hypothetical protein